MSDKPNWRALAACKGLDGDLFFPVGSGLLAQMQERDAKRVCGGCKVRAQCLDWAVSTRQYAGVWGGLTEKERASLYAKDERPFTRCLNAYAWIEEQLALNKSRREIAKTLKVREETLRRALDVMRAERAVEATAGSGAAA